MLYDARHERVLKKGYQVKYVPVHQPAHDVKYVPVYRSPGGDYVFEDEATVDGIAIVEVPGAVPSRSERECAIAKLSCILFAESPPKVDWSQLVHAIDAMAMEPDLKLQVGQQVGQRLPSENPDWELNLAVKLLVDSGLKEAIAPLTSLLEYEASWDHMTCCAGMVHGLAQTTLRKFVAHNPQFLYEAARAALELLARQKNEWYRDLVKTWTIELLRGLASTTDPQRDWAREQLKELGTQVI